MISYIKSNAVKQKDDNREKLIKKRKRSAPSIEKEKQGGMNILKIDKIRKGKEKTIKIQMTEFNENVILIRKIKEKREIIYNKK